MKNKTNVIDYSDGKTLFTMLTKIKDMRLRYYTSGDKTVMLWWNGTWHPYHTLLPMFPALAV